MSTTTQNPKDPTLEELMAGVTKENQHQEIDWGARKGGNLVIILMCDASIDNDKITRLQ